MAKKSLEARDWNITIIPLLLAIIVSLLLYLILSAGFPSDPYSSSLVIILVILIISLLHLAIHGKRSRLYEVYKAITEIVPWW